MTPHKLLIQCGLFVREGILERSECSRALAEISASSAEPAGVYAAGDESTVDARVRKTRSATPPPELVARIGRLFDDLRPELEHHFQAVLRAHEAPEYLLYHRGDLFLPHRDRPRVDDASISSRRVSGVLFLNDDFGGGDLRFYGLIEGARWADIGIPCPAAPGLFVAFPSDLLHEVAPVTTGVRGTIVTWFF